MNIKKMDIVCEYGRPPFRAIVLHGGPGAPGCAAGCLSFLIMSLKNAAMIHGKKNTQGSGFWICWKQK